MNTHTAPVNVIVIGDVACDMLVEMREPLAFGTDTRARIRDCPGGAGANLAAWLARLGVETHLVGRIGRDVLGRALADGLRRDGVIAHLAEDETRPTGKIVVLVNDAGERSMIVDRGANLSIQPEDLPDALFQPGRHLHLSGYCFFEENPRRVALEALERARHAGMTISVDPASVSLLRDLGPRRFLEWTRGAGLIFPNREEGALLCESPAARPGGRKQAQSPEGAPELAWSTGVHVSLAAGLGSTEIEAILTTLRDSYGGVALKLGAQGAAYAGDGETIHLPALPARVVDTTGAGDAFCAAFLAAWLAGRAPAEALQQGLAQAGRIVARIGAR